MPLLQKETFDIWCKKGKDSKFTRDTHKHNHIHFTEQRFYTANSSKVRQAFRLGPEKSRTWYNLTLFNPTTRTLKDTYHPVYTRLTTF